jgi:RNA polymerase sigma-70 factor (ECF subfamily)
MGAATQVAIVAGDGMSAVGAQATAFDDIDAVVREHRPRVLRFVVFSVSDVDVAESITQDCFMKAYTARASFRGDCSVSTWLLNIAVNLVRDYHRVEKFRFWRRAHATAMDVSEAGHVLPSAASTPEAQLIAREKAAQVAAVLERLSPNQRTAFLLRFTEEMELSEMAAAMNMPLATVKTHLHRALKAVRTDLGTAR